MLVAAVCLSALSLCATENADAKETFFIVYQSGGKITPFLDTEIDSIGFSKFDTDSVEHPQWHSQVVYTPDSAYVFPLAQVDSVGFQALPTIYKPQVIHMTSAWEPLVEGYEDNTITFASGISSVWRPKKGDVLFYNEFTERFPYGYSGKVEDMTFDNDRYVITMGEIDLDDIYEQVMNVSRTEWIDTYELPDSLAELDPARKLHPRKIRRARNSFTLSLGGTGTIDIKNVTGSISASYNLTVTTGLVKRPHGDWYFSVKTSPVIQMGASLRAKGKWDFFEYNKDALICFPGLPCRMPIPNTPFMMEVRSGPYASFEGSAEIGELKWSKTIALPVSEVTYEENSWHYDLTTPKNSKNAGWSVDRSLHCECKLTLGAIAVLGFATNNLFGTIPYLEVGLVVKPGLRISINADVDLSADNPYEMFKDSYLEAGLGTETSIEAMCVLGQGLHTPLVKIASVDIPLPWQLKLKMFPDFDPVEWEPGNIKGSITATSMAKEAVLFPQNVGFGIFDEENSLVHRSMMDEQFWLTGEMDMEEDFNGLKPLKKYTLKPVIKLFDKYIEATPTAEVELDMKLETWSAESIESKTAVIRGYCDAIEGGNQTKVGFVYSKEVNPEMNINNATWVEANRTTNGAFSVALSQLEAGTTYGYRACLIRDGEVYYGEMQEFTTTEPPGYAVDLGLSVFWADRNVGATMPHQVGGLFGWADPTGTETSADVMNASGAWDSPLYGGPNPPANISGTASDIARARWHMQWRMPTEAEISELVNECEWEWTTLNDVPGYQVTGPNGNSIFLPVTGYRFGNEIFDSGCGYYWSGTLNSLKRTNAYRIDFTPGDWDYTSYARYAGHAVRPVIDYE